jgi:hypothetical protein
MDRRYRKPHRVKRELMVYLHRERGTKMNAQWIALLGVLLLMGIYGLLAQKANHKHKTEQ